MRFTREIVLSSEPPAIRQRQPLSERQAALAGLWRALKRFHWEVPLQVAFNYWWRIDQGIGDKIPAPEDGPFGHWFWQLGEDERNRFFAPNGYLPPPLARSMVKLLTLSLGFKFSLWQLPDDLAELLEQAHHDLLAASNGGPPALTLPTDHHHLVQSNLPIAALCASETAPQDRPMLSYTPATKPRQLKLFEDC